MEENPPIFRQIYFTNKFLMQLTIVISSMTLLLATMPTTMPGVAAPSSLTIWMDGCCERKGFAADL
jgi:hypothetical protein